MKRKALDAVFRALHRLRHILAEQAGKAHKARLVDLHVAEHQHHPVGPGVLQALPGRFVGAVAPDVEPNHLGAGHPRQRAYLEGHDSLSPSPRQAPRIVGVRRSRQALWASSLSWVNSSVMNR